MTMAVQWADPRDRRRPIEVAAMPVSSLPLSVRFWSKADTSAGLFGCWPWRAARTDKGYGKFSIGDRDLKAPRVAWELHNGPIPPGLCVLHDCDNSSCVNPAHLHLGTIADNNREMDERGRRRHRGPSLLTHCIRGHEFTPENTHNRGNGRRGCHACHRAHGRAQYQRLRLPGEAQT